MVRTTILVVGSLVACSLAIILLALATQPRPAPPSTETAQAAPSTPPGWRGISTRPITPSRRGYGTPEWFRERPPKVEEPPIPPEEMQAREAIAKALTATFGEHEARAEYFAQYLYDSTIVGYSAGVASVTRAEGSWLAEVYVTPKLLRMQTTDWAVESWRFDDDGRLTLVRREAPEPRIVVLMR